jgi:hypothetical protein
MFSIYEYMWFFSIKKVKWKFIELKKDYLQDLYIKYKKMLITVTEDIVIEKCVWILWNAIE